jgi:hypothetical protein
MQNDKSKFKDAVTDLQVCHCTNDLVVRTFRVANYNDMRLEPRIIVYRSESWYNFDLIRNNHGSHPCHPTEIALTDKSGSQWHEEMEG